MIRNATVQKRRGNSQMRSTWDAAVELVGRHKQHIELSPGIDKAVRDYALLLCDDIAMDLRLLQKKYRARYP